MKNELCNFYAIFRFAYFDEPALETFVMNGPNIAFTVAGLNDRSGIGSLIVVADPALVFLVPVIIYAMHLITNQIQK